MGAQRHVRQSCLGQAVRLGGAESLQRNKKSAMAPPIRRFGDHRPLALIPPVVPGAA
jgi:hypothetical protein